MRRTARLTALLTLLPAAVLLASPAAAAQPAEPDLSEVTLRLEDLPGDFGETADLFTIQGLITELLRRAEGAALLGHRVFADGAGAEAVESLLIGPLTPTAQEEFDAWFGRGEEVAREVAQAVPPFDTSGTWAVLDSRGLGDASAACRVIAAEEATVRRSARQEEAVTAVFQAGVPTRLEVALARRGAYLLAVAVTHDGAGETRADALALARILDGRLAEALGLPVGGFRPPGRLVPELTTHIPTPMDVSTDPAVAGTNLLLAALAMVAFAIAAEVLDRTLAAHEERLQRVIGPARWLGRAQQRLDSALFARRRGGRWHDRLRVAGVVALYGVLFSLLQPGWSPFTITGCILLATMTGACAAVGLSGSAAKWVTARRLGLPAGLGLRPANLLLAGASTGLSRAFSLIPGLMFGKPEAFSFGEGTPGDDRQGKVLGAGALTLAGVGAGAWLLTLPTALLLRADLPGWLDGGIGGLQAVLLLVFAVAVQALFIEMLTFPATAGRYLSRRHRVAWAACLVAVAFAFWHTLINPRGRLASALQTANVVFFLAVTGLFVLFAFGLRWYARRVSVSAAGAPAREGAAAEAAASSGAWQPDPVGRHQYRYWNGNRWTDWVADEGVTGRDPFDGR